MFHGLTGPVNAVEVDGTFFIESDEAEAKAARSKTPELEAAVAPKAAENSTAATAALGSGPFSISYAAAASKPKPPVGPKPSAAGGFEPRTVAAPKFSAGLERSTPASEPALARLEVDDFAEAQRTPLPEYVAGIEGDKEGVFYAHSATFGFTSLIPKNFQNTSFEAEEAAKELMFQAAKKAKAEEKAKEVAKKSAKASNTKQKSHQKPAKDKKKTEQTTAPAPAKEDAPAMKSSTSFRALFLVGLVALVTAFHQSMQPSAFTLTTGLTGYSSGAAEVATKNVAGCWSNALNESGRFDVDAPNDDQCGLLDVGAPSYDQCEQFDAPNDSRCTPSESVVASPEAFELTDPAGADDAAKGFGRSASLDAAGAERAEPRRGETEEGCPSQWLPLVFGFAPAQVDHKVDADDVHQPPPAGSHSVPSSMPPSSVLAKAEREPRPLSVQNASDLYSGRVLQALALNIIGDGCHVVNYPSSYSDHNVAGLGCVRSRNYPSSYSDQDTCTIRNPPAHPISVTSFDVENACNPDLAFSTCYGYSQGYSGSTIGCIWDHLTVNNRRYCGTNSPEGVVPDGTPIEWKADYSVTRSGWEICFRPEVKTAMLTGHTYAACQGIYSKSDDMLNGKPIWDRTTGSRFIFWCGGAWRVTGSQWRQAFLNLQIGHCGAFISSKTATGDAVEHWWAADWSNNGAGIGAIPLV